jgi:hypothetical protein
VIEDIDLNQQASPLVGRWEFSSVEARKHWYGSELLYEYVLACPLKQPPLHDELTVRLTFTVELTHRTLDAQKVVKLTLAPAAATQPAVQADR